MKRKVLSLSFILSGGHLRVSKRKKNGQDFKFRTVNYFVEEKSTRFIKCLLSFLLC